MSCSATIQCLRIYYSKKKGSSILYQSIPMYRARKVQNTVTAARKPLKPVWNCEAQSQVVSPNNSTNSIASKIVAMRNKQKSIYKGQCNTTKHSSGLKYYKISFHQQSLFVQFLHTSITLTDNPNALYYLMLYTQHLQTSLRAKTCSEIRHPNGNTHN